MNKNKIKHLKNFKPNYVFYLSPTFFERFKVLL